MDAPKIGSTPKFGQPGRPFRAHIFYTPPTQGCASLHPGLSPYAPLGRGFLMPRQPRVALRFTLGYHRMPLQGAYFLCHANPGLRDAPPWAITVCPDGAIDCVPLMRQFFVCLLRSAWDVGTQFRGAFFLPCCCGLGLWVICVSPAVINKCFWRRIIIVAENPTHEAFIQVPRLGTR